jgi:fucose permease
LQGFVAGSTLNVVLNDKLGFGKVRDRPKTKTVSGRNLDRVIQTIALGSAAQMVAFGIQASAPPFPLFAIAYSISGFGASFEDAQANGFVASYKDNAATKMGILHAAYGEDAFILHHHRSASFGCSGVGALTAPLVATQFSQLHRWSFHYLASFGVATLNTVLLVCVFKLKAQDGTTFLLDMTSDLTHWSGSECLAQIGQLPEEKESADGNKYKKMFKLKALHLLALFILVYVGVEVTIGGT